MWNFLKINAFQLFDIVRNVFMILCGYLIYLASFVEPSPAIWVVSASGALITIVMGQDRGLTSFFGHFAIGIGIGVFGSQILHYYINISQIPLSFIASLFAMEFFLFMQRNLRNSSVTELLSVVLNRKKTEK